MIIDAIATFAGIVLSILRVAGHKSQAFQAIAHMYMGALITYAIMTRDWYLGGVAIVMSCIELAAFLVGRKR